MTDPTAPDVELAVPARIGVGDRDAGVAPRPRTRLEVAVGEGAAVTALGGLVVVGRPLDPGHAVSILVAVAGVLLAALATRRAPSVAWLAAIVGSYAAATLLFEAARDVNRLTVELWLWLAIAAVASLAAILTMSIAAGYATRPGIRVGRLAVPFARVALGWLIVGCLTTLGLVAAGQRTPDPAINWVDIV